MGNEYQYEPEQGDANPDTGEIINIDNHPFWGEIESMIIEDGYLTINNEYATEITPSVMKQLSWDPKVVRFLKGTYQGKYTYSWDTEKSKGSYDVNILRMSHSDRVVDMLLPDWSAITNKLAEFDIGTEIVVIYNGLITLKNGHPYHDVTIARKK